MRFFVIAGEASGDIHGANLINAIRKRVPDATFEGFGGDLLQAAGMRVIRPLDKLNFMGFIEVVKNLNTVRENLRICKKVLQSAPPDALILIDYPGFNLRMAAWAKQHGIKVFYYISPQVWAWKESRVEQMKRNIDRLMVILSFEKEFFAKRGMEVDFVGHPLIDEIEKRRHISVVKKEMAVALLPGSRKQEIRHVLPEMLKIQEYFPGHRFIIGKASNIEKSFYQKNFELGNAEIFEGGTYQLLSRAEAALVTSGTATLETALLRVPQVVCYKAGAISVRIARSLIRVPYISLVNLILDRPAVKELIQNELNEPMLVDELRRLTEDREAIATMQADYREVWDKLGGGGASERAAGLIEHDLSRWTQDK